ncbi:mucin-5AC-like [Girardinichthys multiradiatus]|uniref:mucin-5AC-like n=1 Tax=Girardinichthys multiradiatus TaxID=208333 RepID=UPI001FAD25B8|nr:mucin-5AC-like [Girardinichthys multiradiatus]
MEKPVTTGSTTSTVLVTTSKNYKETAKLQDTSRQSTPNVTTTSKTLTTQSTETLQTSTSVLDNSEVPTTSAPIATQPTPAEQMVGMSIIQSTNSGLVSVPITSTTQTGQSVRFVQSATNSEAGLPTAKTQISTTDHSSTLIVESLTTTSTVRSPSSVISTIGTSVRVTASPPSARFRTDTEEPEKHNQCNVTTQLQNKSGQHRVTQETQTDATETTKMHVPTKLSTGKTKTTESITVQRTTQSGPVFLLTSQTSLHSATQIQSSSSITKTKTTTRDHQSTDIVGLLMTTTTAAPVSSMAFTLVAQPVTNTSTTTGMEPAVPATDYLTLSTTAHASLTASSQSSGLSNQTQTPTQGGEVTPWTEEAFTRQKWEHMGTTINPDDTTATLVTSPQEKKHSAAHINTLEEGPKILTATGTTDQNSTSSQSIESSITEQPSSQQPHYISLVPVSTPRSTSSSTSSLGSSSKESHSNSTSPQVYPTTNMEKATTKSTEVQYESTETTNSILYASSANLGQANTSTLSVSQNSTVFFRHSPRVVVLKPLVFNYPVVNHTTFLSNDTGEKRQN